MVKQTMLSHWSQTANRQGRVRPINGARRCCRSIIHRRTFFKWLSKNSIRVWRVWMSNPACRLCGVTASQPRSQPPSQPPQQTVNIPKKKRTRKVPRAFMFRRRPASALRVTDKLWACPRSPEGSQLFLNRNMRKIFQNVNRPRPTRPGLPSPAGAVVEAVSRRLRTTDASTDSPPLYFYVEYLEDLVKISK